MLYQINAIIMLKKKSTQSKISNKKLTLGFLYEMVFVWNIYNSSARVCKNSGTISYKKILVRSDSYAFVRSGLPCTKWSLFEMVFVRSDCQSFEILPCKIVLIRNVNWLILKSGRRVVRSALKIFFYCLSVNKRLY